MRPVKFLVVHCSDGPNGRPDTAEDVHRWHLERGWVGIGYHAVIEVDGGVRMGRPTYWEGAHVREHNDESLGVCLIGTDTFSDAQMNSLEGLLIAWQVEFPGARVVGHEDLDEQGKTCPNFDVRAWWAERSKKHIG